MTAHQLQIDPRAAERILARVLQHHIAAPERLTVSEWADKYRVLADKSAVRKGKWETDYSPHLRAVMDAFSDPTVQHISIMKPTQCGGTEAVINMMLYAVDCAPGDVFWVWANKENAEEFGQERLLPNIKACDRISHYLSGAKHDETKRNIILTHMTFRFRGSPQHSKAEQNLESWPARYIANDELDRCSLNTPEIMEARTSGYPTTKKLIDLGSPEMEDQGIDAQVKNSAGGGLYFWTPCPFCKVHFVRNFDMVHWEGGSKAKWEVVKDEAWLRCPSCDKKIDGWQNRDMMRAGVWAPDWDETKPIEKNPLPTQERIDECLHAKHVGFRIGEFSDPHAVNAFGDVAASFLRHKCFLGPTQSWTNKVRGRPWSIKGERAQESDLRKLCVPVELGGYKMGTVPPGVMFLETAIDVQRKEAWVRVRGWGLGGGESWLIDVYRVPIANGDLTALDKFVGRRYPLADRWCDHNGEVPQRVEGVQPMMRSCLTCIDSGNTNDDIDVYSWVLRHGGAKRNVFAVKGQPGTGNQNTRSYWKTELETMPGGRPIPGGGTLALINVNTMHWKKWVISRTSPKRDMDQGLDGGLEAVSDDETIGGVEEPGEIRGQMGYCLWRFPEAVYELGRHEEATSAWQMERYFRQITSEELIEKTVDGVPKRYWRLRPGGGRQNHLFDCECYGAAVLALRSMWGRDLTRAYGVTTGAEKAANTQPVAPQGPPEPVSPQSMPQKRPTGPQPSFMRHLRG